MVRMSYKACMNQTELNQLKTSSDFLSLKFPKFENFSLLFETLKDLGDWPMLRNDGKLREDPKSITGNLLLSIEYEYNVFLKHYKESNRIWFARKHQVQINPRHHLLTLVKISLDAWILSTLEVFQIFSSLLVTTVSTFSSNSTSMPTRRTLPTTRCSSIRALWL